MLSGDIFFCNQKPFGPHGPTLDEVLTMQDDNFESKISPVSDDEKPKKGSAFKPDNKEKRDTGDKNKNENETYLFIPDIKTNGESKIEMYFVNLFGVKNIKTLFIEKKAAIALKSVPISSKTENIVISSKVELNLKTSYCINLKNIASTLKSTKKRSTKCLHLETSN